MSVIAILVGGVIAVAAFLGALGPSAGPLGGARLPRCVGSCCSRSERCPRRCGRCCSSWCSRGRCLAPSPSGSTTPGCWAGSSPRIPRDHGPPAGQGPCSCWVLDPCRRSPTGCSLRDRAVHRLRPVPLGGRDPADGGGGRGRRRRARRVLELSVPPSTTPGCLPRCWPCCCSRCWSTWSAPRPGAPGADLERSAGAVGPRRSHERGPGGLGVDQPVVAQGEGALDRGQHAGDRDRDVQPGGQLDRRGVTAPTRSATGGGS